ncbi:ARMT1-like domain-containing protein [Amycolatopsis sp. NBC_00355]|uniref:ARMT1-like domain-containing protein n=1 Tax=Amycolatopsis sp. NBC_00355 TaxID=2975957 RepID=UPI003FA4C3F1
MTSGMQIKGRRPRLEYQNSVEAVWRRVVSTNSDDIIQQIDTTATLIANIYGAADSEETSGSTLCRYSKERPLELLLGIPSGRGLSGPAKLPKPRPFLIDLSQKEDLLPVCDWSDSFLKQAAEIVGDQARLSAQEIQRIGGSLVECMGLLLAWPRLQAHLGFNNLTYIQELLLKIVLGPRIAHLWSYRTRTGRRLNTEAHRVMCLLPWSDSSELLLARNASAGLLWNSPQVIGSSQWLDDVVSRLSTPVLAVDDTELLFARLVQPDSELTIVLDDNGEAVFDLAWIIQLFTTFPRLRIHVLVNPMPLSMNLSKATLGHAINSFPALMPIKWYINRKRLQVSYVRQYAPALEYGWLPPSLRRRIDSSGVVYLKGASLFENFAELHLFRFHVFAAYGYSTTRLTGLTEGEPVAMGLKIGEVGYGVNDTGVVTALDIVSSRL